MTTRATIDAIIAKPALAIVGVSRSGKKFGNAAYRELSTKGYRLYPIHPGAPVINGHPSYASFADLPEPVDAVLVVVPPVQAAQVVRDAAAAGIHYAWLQQGAESAEVLKVCDELGIQTVAGECILMFAQPRGIHKLHQWLRGLVRAIPS